MKKQLLCALRILLDEQACKEGGCEDAVGTAGGTRKYGFKISDGAFPVVVETSNSASELGCYAISKLQRPRVPGLSTIEASGTVFV